MFPDIKSQAQATVKILAGKELGLSPFQSMKDLYLVSGKLPIQSNALAALVKAHKSHDYRVIEHTAELCKIEFFQEGESIGVSEFTIKDAAKSGIINKDVWKKFPKNMLFARALANGVRWFCPNVAIGWHVSEELEDVYDTDNTPKETITLTADGEVVNGES
jgi:hypothetical protein